MGRYTQHFDWITALVLLCLGCFGLFLLLTLGFDVFLQQCLFLIVGFILIGIFSFIDPILLWWFAPVAYVLGNIFLLSSYLGPHIRGATRWLVLGPIQLQPSELCKPLFLLGFSFFISKYSPRILRNLPLHFILFLIPFLLVFRQPDLGSGIVYSCMWFAMLLAGGLPLSFVLTFLNPSLDPSGAGYNALQAMIAVGSGQIFGRGLGRGTQSHLRFLPEHHTDFIFATLIEELGFIGGLLLLIAYAILLVRIITPFFRGIRQEAGVFIFSLGLFAMLLSQIFINTGMNMGLIPITGITLPFVSYGGSSILSFTVSFGLLWALQKGQTDDTTIAIG